MGDHKATSSREAQQTWTTRRLLGWMQSHFESRQIESPRLVGEMLLAYVLDCDRMRLYMEVDRPASPEELARLRELVARAAKHEPVQYLVGHGWFYKGDFEVNRSTLIPRPSTETLVEQVLQWHRTAGVASPLIADIGTGTGCIAVSIAAHIKDARLLATDVSSDAVKLARQNAAKYGVEDCIEFACGSLLEPLKQGPPGRRFDVICSNPPYIPDHEWADVPENVKDYEPATALRAGHDGLDCLRPLIEESRPFLATDGRLVLEIADSQHREVKALAAEAGYSKATVLKDYENLWRVLVAHA